MPLEDGAALAWLYRQGQVVSRDDDESHAHLRVRLSAANRARFESRFGAEAPVAASPA